MSVFVTNSLHVFVDLFFYSVCRYINGAVHKAHLRTLLVKKKQFDLFNCDEAATLSVYFSLPINILQGILTGASHMAIHVSQMCVSPMRIGTGRTEV